MAVAIRTITRLQDADDVNVSLGAGVDEYALSWDNDTAMFVLRAVAVGVTDHGALTGLADDDHTGYLLATGARTGASSQAQAFTNGIIGPTWKPASDSTTALQMQNAAGTAVLTVDTTNKILGIGTDPVVGDTLNVFASRTGAGNVRAMNFLTYKYDSTGTVYAWGAMGSVQNLANAADSNVTVMQGLAASCNTTAAAGRTATTSYAMTIAANAPVVGGAGTKTVSNNYGLYVYNQGATGITNAHGIYVEAVSGAATNNKALVTEGGSVIFNENGTDSDFRIEGDTDTHLLFVDASADRVGIGASSPDSKLHIHLDDAATNAASQLLTLSHNTTGAVANGYGSRVLWELKSSTTADQAAAALDVTWTDATHASRTGRLALYGSYTGTLYEGLRVGAVSGAAALGFYGVTAIARPTTSSAAASFTANSGTAVNDASTFDGYTIKQIVKALRDIGILT